MANMYGIATALYGENPRRMTTSVVCGKNKKEIRVVARTDHNLDDNLSGSVCTAVGSLLDVVNAVVRANSSGIKGHPLVVVYGSSTDFAARDILERMYSTYQSGLKGISVVMKNLDNPILLQVAASSGVETTQQGIERSVLGQGLGILIQNLGYEPELLQLEPRLYLNRNNRSCDPLWSGSGSHNDQRH